MNIELVAAHRKYLPSDYRKHKVIVNLRAPGPARVASYWDGGSRSYYTLFRNDERIENYLRTEGLRYRCTDPKLPSRDECGTYGMAYEPANVFENEAQAKCTARNRVREEINKLWALLESLK